MPRLVRGAAILLSLGTFTLTLAAAADAAAAAPAARHASTARTAAPSEAVSSKAGASRTGASQAGAAPAAAATIAAKTAGMRRIDGFMPLYWDEPAGKLWLEITRFDTELLYQTSLPAGVGSNPIGLDRGALGDTHVVTFQRIGPKVLMIEPNYRYRALSSDPAERRAVQDSFAQSVLFGFKVEASDGARVLVDATPLVLRDGYGVVDRLRQTRQGSYRFDDSRSAIYLPRTKGFPQNTEIEATLTFVTDGDPGPLVRQVTPTAQAVTVRQHHSFIELPALAGTAPGAAAGTAAGTPAAGATAYTPRIVDPRVGAFGIDFHDYASPITDPIEKRWIVRHRLQKTNPAAAISDVVKPIVYYVDNGAPEPIRSALVEGASWWAAAFEAAGFRNAFQVKVLPADADPMDVRYNVINWVHRSTRGWSYGSSIVDPRTGEILKGHVTLGSLRVRQDYMLGTGMIPTYASAAGAAGVAAGLAGEADFAGQTPGARAACDFGWIPEIDYLIDAAMPAASAPATSAADASAAATSAAAPAPLTATVSSESTQPQPNSPSATPGADPSLAMSLARIRQLSAHEVGHTLGFAHNFAASTYGGRASVMDYPAPQVDIKNGVLDLSNAYGRGVGAYDTWVVRFAYAQFAPNANEAAALEAIVQEGVKANLLYLTDQDARPAGAAHPLASLWDNGSDPIATLRHEMDVRRIGLSQFGLKSVPVGSPLSLLEAKLLPLYLHHRYQLNAAVKSIGGAHYSYSVRAANGASPSLVQQIVPAATQRDALAAVLATITPEALALPASILGLIPPHAAEFGSVNTELFEGRTAPVFDPLSAASIAADLAISGLVQYQRAGRLNQFHVLDAANPDFADVLREMIRQIWEAPRPVSSQHQALQRMVQQLFVTRLMDVASLEQAAPQVRADATAALRAIQQLCERDPAPTVPGATTTPAPATSVDAVTDATRSHRAAVRDDITRFLNRPDTTFKRVAPLPTPPGDPIGSRGATRP